MQKFNFTITVEANSEQEASVKLTAASTLMKKLKSNEIKKLAEVVTNDPVKTNFAKKALGL